MSSIKNNIAILCLSNNYVKYLGKKLSDDLDMFFANIGDILEYNLINENMLETAGKKYFDEQQERIINSVCQYENTIICGKFEILINNVDRLKNNSLLIYLKLDKKTIEKYEKNDKNTEFFLKEITFEQEDKLCMDCADIVISIADNDNQNIQAIKKSIINYYKENQNEYWPKKY